MALNLALKLMFCRVCGCEGAHGTHFGAVTCRACAAFFRRTAHSKLSSSKCRGGSCDRVIYFCKSCRLAKCFKVGMHTSNFQYNRDSLHNSINHQAYSQALLDNKKSIPQTVECFVGRPGMVLFWDSQAPTHKTMIDVNYLIVEAQKVFNQHPESLFLCKTQLERLSIGMKLIRSGKMAEEYGKCTLINQKEVSDTWQYYFLTVAKWFMHFEEFQKLEMGDKMKILQVVWHIWATLDRHYSTSIYRKNSQNIKKTEIVARKGVVIDLMNVHFDATWLSDHPSRQIAYFLRQGARENFDIIGALGELEPSDVELSFMLAQLSFEYAGKRYQGEILKICEHFQAILADDLHNYYVGERKMVNYSRRLAKMMKINNAIQKNLWEHRPRMELAKVFNIIKIEFSHPEMFKDSGFN